MLLWLLLVGLLLIVVSFVWGWWNSTPSPSRDLAGPQKSAQKPPPPAEAMATPSTPALSSFLIEQDFKDGTDSRHPAQFELLAPLLKDGKPSNAECARICIQQTALTPDFDMPYIWASNYLEAAGNMQASVEILDQGLRSCRLVSGILTRLGMRYITLRNPMLATICFGKGILSQPPFRAENPRASYHQPYLYFAYVCIAAGYGNAGTSALKVARRIRHAIDLNDECQAELARVISPAATDLQPIIHSLLRPMEFLDHGKESLST